MTGTGKCAHYFFQKRVSSQRAILRASIPTLSDCRHIPDDNGRTATNVSWVLEMNRELHPGLLRSAYHHNVGNSEGYLFVSLPIARKSKALLDHLSRGGNEPPSAYAPDTQTYLFFFDSSFGRILQYLLAQAPKPPSVSAERCGVADA